MAQSTLALPTPSEFPQPQFGGNLIAGLDSLVSGVFAKNYNFSTCAHESPESSYGASDGGFPCRKTAVVHDLSTGEEFCLEHFDGVIA